MTHTVLIADDEPSVRMLVQATIEADGYKVLEASDGDEAWAVSLAINFCADYVDGRPLRWSPVVVELFLANWIPRKVLR